MIFFPMIIYYLLPLFIFMSLFFIPDHYQGVFIYSKTMQGTSQNKWLFDMFGFYSGVLFFLSIAKYVTFGLPSNVSKLIIENFILNGSGKNYNIRVISVLPIIIFIAIIFYLCFFTLIEAVNSPRNINDFQRNVFINFFIFYILKCLPILLAICFFIQAMEIKRNVM